MAIKIKNGINLQGGVITFPDATTQATAATGGAAAASTFLSSAKWGAD